MLELKDVLLIFGVVFLLVAITRRILKKQKPQTAHSVKSTQAAAPVTKTRMTEEQFTHSWKSLGYLMLLAAVGNLYMGYNSLKGALETQSYILWMDTAFSLAAAVIAVLIWRLHSKTLVISYLIVTILPIMVFISTGHSNDGIVHLFPLMLVYFAVKPVWEYIE